jgi:hypothetical protein
LRSRGPELWSNIRFIIIIVIVVNIIIIVIITELQNTAG